MPSLNILVNADFIPGWQLAFLGVVYPCLVLAYMGEAAYLTKHKEDLRSSFYKSIPGRAFLFDPGSSLWHFMTVSGQILRGFLLLSQLYIFPSIISFDLMNLHVYFFIYSNRFMSEFISITAFHNHEWYDFMQVSGCLIQQGHYMIMIYQNLRGLFLLSS